MLAADNNLDLDNLTLRIEVTEIYLHGNWLVVEM